MTLAIGSPTFRLSRPSNSNIIRIERSETQGACLPQIPPRISLRSMQAMAPGHPAPLLPLAAHKLRHPAPCPSPHPGASWRLIEAMGATMTAFNAVRFRVKPGRDQDFLDAHRNIQADWPGLRHVNII